MEAATSPTQNVKSKQFLSNRFYSLLTYNDRQLAVSEGFKFSMDVKAWFIDESHEKFEYLKDKYEGIQLNVPYESRSEAKILGCIWKPSKKSWFISKHRLHLIEEGWKTSD